MDETTKIEQQVTTQEPTAWQAWNAAVGRYIGLLDQVAHIGTTLETARDAVKAELEKMHTEE